MNVYSLGGGGDVVVVVEYSSRFFSNSFCVVGWTSIFAVGLLPDRENEEAFLTLALSG